VNTRRCKRSSGAVAVAGTAWILLPASAAHAQERAEPDTSEIPQQIMEALTARFPEAAIDKWTMEKEGEIIVYDVEFRQNGRRFEADIREDGSIHNWEQEIAISDLPEVVRASAEERYPGIVIQEIMAITAVTDGDEELEGYEIVFQGKDGDIEMTVAPAGGILEDAGEGD
jgi:hypothetical protein